VVAAVAAVIILAAMGSSAAVERHEGSSSVKGWFESGWMDIAQAGRLASTPVPIT
jgi:hypothetical protein